MRRGQGEDTRDAPPALQVGGSVTLRLRLLQFLLLLLLLLSRMAKALQRM